MNQHTGELTKAILEAAKRKNGMRTNQIAGYSVNQVGRMCNKLRLAGDLFVARISHKVARYYTDEAAAKAAHVAPSTKRHGPKLTVIRARAAIGPGHLDCEPTESSNCKTTIAPPIPDRFGPTGPVPSVFGRTPGKYTEAAASCAARAA